MFEILFKSFEILEINVNDEFWTDYFEMSYEISGAGSFNIETWQFWFIFDNRFSLTQHEAFP